MKQDTLEGKTKTKNGVKRLCFSIVCILLEVVFIITIVTRLNEYAEIINLFTRILSGILVLELYASDKTSSMKMPWVILILIFPIMGVGLYLLIGLNGEKALASQIPCAAFFRNQQLRAACATAAFQHFCQLANVQNIIPQAQMIFVHIFAAG